MLNAVFVILFMFFLRESPFTLPVHFRFLSILWVSLVSFGYCFRSRFIFVLLESIPMFTGSGSGGLMCMYARQPRGAMHWRPGASWTPTTTSSLTTFALCEWCVCLAVKRRSCDASSGSRPQSCTNQVDRPLLPPSAHFSPSSFRACCMTQLCGMKLD